MIQFVHNFYSSHNWIQNISVCRLTSPITKQTFCDRGSICFPKNEKRGKDLPYNDTRCTQTSKSIINC